MTAASKGPFVGLEASFEVTLLIDESSASPHVHLPELRNRGSVLSPYTALITLLSDHSTLCLFSVLGFQHPMGTRDSCLGASEHCRQGGHSRRWQDSALEDAYLEVQGAYGLARPPPMGSYMLGALEP